MTSVAEPAWLRQQILAGAGSEDTAPAPAEMKKKFWTHFSSFIQIMIWRVGCCKFFFLIVKSLLFIGAGAGAEKNGAGKKTDRLCNSADDTTNNNDTTKQWQMIDIGIDTTNKNDNGITNYNDIANDNNEQFSRSTENRKRMVKNCKNHLRSMNRSTVHLRQTKPSWNNNSRDIVPSMNNYLEWWQFFELPGSVLPSFHLLAVVPLLLHLFLFS